MVVFYLLEIYMIQKCDDWVLCLIERLFFDQCGIFVLMMVQDYYVEVMIIVGFEFVLIWFLDVIVEIDLVDGFQVY